MDFDKLLEKVKEAEIKKAHLTEKKTSNEIKDILKKKGW